RPPLPLHPHPFPTRRSSDLFPSCLGRIGCKVPWNGDVSRSNMITAPAETRSDIALAVPSERPVELSIVMPCLNEAETFASCINKDRKSTRLNSSHVAISYAV